MSIPVEPVAVPDTVSTLADGAALVPVWLNGYGGLTFRTDDVRFIRWGPRNLETSFAAEAERLEWAAPFTPVPRVIELGGDETLLRRIAQGRHPPAPRQAVRQGKSC